MFNIWIATLENLEFDWVYWQMSFIMLKFLTARITHFTVQLRYVALHIF